MTDNAVPQNTSIDLDHEFTKGFAARYIRRKSRQLLGHASLRKSDRADVEQELKLEVWKAIPNFDPAAGDWRSFVATIVERQAEQLLIHRRAAKRNQNNAIESLDVLVTDADGVEVSLASQIGPDHRFSVTGVQQLDDLEHTELRIDVETILAPLTDDQRELLHELAELSQLDVASLRGISRRTLRGLLEQARRRIFMTDENSEVPASTCVCGRSSPCESKNIEKVTARFRADSKA